MSSIGGYFCQSIAGMFIQSIAGMRGCGSLPCDIGACCTSVGFGIGLCIDGVPAQMCPNVGTQTFSKDKLCDSVQCGASPFGACCSSSFTGGAVGHCRNLTLENCFASGGNFLGNGTACELISSTPVLPGGSTCNNTFGPGSGPLVGGCCFFAGFCGSLPDCHCTGGCNPFGQVPLGTFLGAGKICNTFGQLCPDKGRCCTAATGNCADFVRSIDCQPPNKFFLHEKCDRYNNPKCPGKCVAGCGSTTKCIDNIPKAGCVGGTWTFGACT